MASPPLLTLVRPASTRVDNDRDGVDDSRRHHDRRTHPNHYGGQLTEQSPASCAAPCAALKGGLGSGQQTWRDDQHVGNARGLSNRDGHPGSLLMLDHPNDILSGGDTAERPATSSVGQGSLQDDAGRLRSGRSDQLHSKVGQRMTASIQHTSRNPAGILRQQRRTATQPRDQQNRDEHTQRAASPSLHPLTHTCRGPDRYVTASRVHSRRQRPRCQALRFRRYTSRPSEV